MAKNYQSLPTVNLTKHTPYVHAGEQPEITHIDDSALDIMIDFKTVKAITISQTAPIADARAKMQACGIHMLLVTDQEDGVIGLITSEDILGEKPVLAAQEKFISRAEVKVSMILVPAEQVIAIEYSVLQLAKVAHIIQTLHQNKQHYALVIDTDTDKTIVRGMFSLSQISKQLDKNILDDFLPASTLAELNRKIDN